MSKKESKNLFKETFETLKPVKVRLSSLFQKSKEGTLEPNEEVEVKLLVRALNIFTGKIKVCSTTIGVE